MEVVRARHFSHTKWATRRVQLRILSGLGQNCARGQLAGPQLAQCALPAGMAGSPGGGGVPTRGAHGLQPGGPPGLLSMEAVPGANWRVWVGSKAGGPRTNRGRQ
jgi:hypothetical protein